jgi:hypothetical protein
MAEAAARHDPHPRSEAVILKLILGEWYRLEHGSSYTIQRIGSLLNELYPQLKGEKRWKKYVADNLPFSQRTADRWRRFATEAAAARAPRHVSDVDQGGTFNQKNPRHESRAHQAWRETLGAAKERLRSVHPAHHDGTRAAADRRRYVQDLATQIITVGYHGLAAKLHPDRGGKTDDMACLTEAKQLCLRGLRWMGVRNNS